MKAVIRKKEYDTQTASVEYKATHGAFGESTGYEETLYLTPDGNYFVYAYGGADSPYPEETIQPLAKTKVKAWLAEHQA